ncbi:magnesium transporter [Dysosmobacter sp. NSJ-60]|uniref:Magnesium transporter MgtE n=1 Tax=Pusillibacter faecalis TaxID=2714358 RepID=A0A810QG32_9FIRM|nr:magnesium transporter [Pusillibacter faecalis]MBC5748445.1 magnesium transporter [Dysosmobacter hominis]MBS5658603.1 magnesium transporter [Oscillibacter sp.]MCQ5027400.1 magnesium transporter [Oscillibacter valericigenes]BCK84551.1 magnesium transporter MgtE [Pusillibacter faecalis]
MFELENERTELLKKIEDDLERKQYAHLRDLLLPLEAADIAALCEEMDDKVPLMFRLLPKELAAEVFVELDSDEQEILIRSFSNTELKEVLDELYLDDTVDIVEEMPAIVVKRILQHSDPDTRKSINEILKYPDDSAGSIMTTEFVDLKETMTVEDALKRIRRTGPDKETINICYVIDDGRHLLGLLSIRTLLLSEEDDVIHDIMQTNIISVQTLDDQEAVARSLSKYGFLALPVVDQENRLVGIITVDDAMDVLQEEVTEDIEKMAAMLPSDKPYLKTGIFETFKARIPWLLLLMISATFTGQIISTFENALAAATILTAYIPMLMDTGGNCGSQASVSVIRGISLNEIEFSDLLQVIWKEIRVAVICGVALSAANFVKLMLVDRLLFHNQLVTIPVAAVICSTMVCTVLCAKLVGCTLPLLAKKIGFDPAVMASPFITTIVDAISLLIYFQFASAILGL